MVPRKHSAVHPQILDRAIFIEVNLATSAMLLPSYKHVTIFGSGAAMDSSMWQFVSSVEVLPRLHGPIVHHKVQSLIGLPTMVAPNVVHFAIIQIQLTNFSFIVSAHIDITIASCSA